MTRFLRAQWAVALPAFVYLFVFPYLPQLRSPNELCRLHQTRAIVDHHSLELNAVMAEQGYIGDLSCVAVARNPDGTVRDRKPCPSVRGNPVFREEHYYPSKAPLLSFIAAPVYRLLELWNRVVPEVPLVFFSRLACIILPSILMLIPLRRFLRELASEPVADAILVAYALGTLAFSYSELFMSHQTTAVLLFLCFYILWRAGRGEWRPAAYLLAGFLAGLTVFAEYTGALALVPLAIYGVATAPGGWNGRAKAAGLALAGVAPVAIALGWYHFVLFGSPFLSGYKFLNDAQYQGWHMGGFLGIRFPDPKALALSFFDPLRGLFVLSPFLLLAIPGFAPRFWLAGRRAELALSLALLIAYTYFTSSFPYESWGWTTGPRHLTPLVPFLLIPVAGFIESVRARPVLAGIAAGLMMVSIVVTSALTFVNYISDSLRNPIYEIAYPLPLSGHLPNTLLSLAGVSNPWAAIPLLLTVAAAVVLAAIHVIGTSRGIAAAAAIIGTIAIHAGALLMVPVDDAAKHRDDVTYQFMVDRWVPEPRHASPPFWSAWAGTPIPKVIGARR